MPPSAPSTTKSAIWQAAHRLFVAHGYAGASVRDIAAEVGVDAALVMRHFGSKENLFIDTMRVDAPNEAVLDGPRGSLGVRYIAFLLDAGEEVRAMYLALVRASASDAVGDRLRRAHEEAFVAPLRARLGDADADARARLAAAIVGGMLYALWLVPDARLAALGRDRLIAMFGDQLQRALDGGA